MKRPIETAAAYSVESAERREMTETLNTYEVLFEYVGGGTDRKRIKGTSHYTATRDFYEQYRGERYIISCKQVIDKTA
jgi:hypothetical protein